MNLHGIVAGVIGAVNPHTVGTVSINTGSTDTPSGVRVPTYRDYPNIRMQVQSLTFRDLMQLDGLNMNGERRKIYLFGEVDAIVRAFNKGGDLIRIANGVHRGTWLVAQTLEQFPGWCSVAATLQNEG